MKNAIIAVLALLCGFLGWKLYYNSPSQSLKELTEEKTLERIVNKTGIYSNKDINNMIRHFHNHTIRDLKDPNGTPPNDKTDGKVTKFVEFDTTVLGNAIRNSVDGRIYFIFAAFTKSEAEVYVNDWNNTHPIAEDKIKLSEVIQKPTIILSFKDPKKSIVTLNVGKICPPPSSVCP